MLCGRRLAALVSGGEFHRAPAYARLVTDSTTSTPNFGPLGENYVERLCSLAFAKDFVFRSPKYGRGSAEKELCDVLVLADTTALLFEVKTPDMTRATRWPREKITRWVAKKTREATSQLEGGFRALVKGLVPNVTNARRTVPLQHGAISRFHAIAAVHHPRGVALARPPVFECRGVRCDMLIASFDDLSAMLRELSTINDVVDYLQVRQRLMARSSELPGSELDMLAAYKSQWPKLEYALENSLDVRFRDDVWSKYATPELLQARDDRNRPSVFIDNLIDRLHTSRGYVPEHLPPGTRPIDDYARIALLLNGLRRVERRDLGRLVLHKARLCDSTGRGRYFGIRAHNGVGYVFRVSNEDRKTRSERLAALVEEAMDELECRTTVGITMNSAQSTNFSFDAVLMELQVDQKPRERRHGNEVPRLFKTPRHKESYEWPEQGTPPSNRFKRRKKRSR